METVLTILAIVVVSVMSTGVAWCFLDRLESRKNSKTKIVIGLGYDRIITLGMKYIERGWMTSDEYANLYKYIYEPYRELRPGDGSITKVMQKVNELPIRSR